MFFPFGQDFGWSVDNFGATYTNTGIGTNIPGNASANVKGANTQVLTGIAEDCYGIAIGFSGGFTSTAARRNLVDLIVDPAAGVGGAGSSWSVIIANLLCNGPSFSAGTVGYWYYFPLYLKAGTAIGLVNQSSNTTTTLQGMVRVYGKPKRIDAIRCGTKVQTYGAVTGSTTGTAITPGTSALGSYTASLGTASYDQWWWQGGIGDNDTSRTANSYLVEIAANATNKIRCGDFFYHVAGTVEQSGKSAMGLFLPYKEISSGQNIYMRAAAAAAPDSSMVCVAYGLGG